MQTTEQPVDTTELTAKTAAQATALNNLMAQAGFIFTGLVSSGKSAWNTFVNLNKPEKFDTANALVYLIENAPVAVDLLKNFGSTVSTDTLADTLAGQDVNIEGDLETLTGKDLDLDKALQKLGKSSFDPHNYPIAWGTTHAVASAATAGLAGYAGLWGKLGATVVNTVLFNLDVYGIINVDNRYAHCAIKTAESSVGDYLYLSALGPQALGGFAVMHFYACASHNKALSNTLNMMKVVQAVQIGNIPSKIMAYTLGTNIAVETTSTIVKIDSHPTDVNRDSQFAGETDSHHVDEL